MSRSFFQCKLDMAIDTYFMRGFHYFMLLPFSTQTPGARPAPETRISRGRHHFYLCLCLVAVALSHGQKKSGKGHRERNREQHQRRREERGEPAYGQSHNDPPVDELTGKRPRRLDPSHVIDCKFAAKFGRKEAQECQAIRRERQRYVHRYT